MGKNHDHDCCCGHDHDHVEDQELHDEHDCCCEDDEFELIMLVDEEGEEHPFEMIFVVEVDEKAYAVLGSLEEEDLTVIMELVGDDEEELELHPIEDEEELERVIEFVRQELEAGNED